MSAHEELRIHKISISSPGVLEVIGALNPLETIRQYLRDRQQAKLDESKLAKEGERDEKYRDAIEQAKATLDIESLKTKVAREKADLLRDAGFSQEEIRPYIKELLDKPLEQLLVYQNQSKLECTAIVSLKLVPVEVIEDTRIDERESNRGLMLLPGSE